MTTTFPTDNRNILNENDAVTGWSGDNSAELKTADPDPVEDTGCLGIDVGTANEYMEYTITSDDYSLGGTLTVWMQLNGTMDTTVGATGGGAQIVIGDGTNTIGYHVGGSDKAGFRHDDGPVGWQCFVLDPANKPANNTAYAGTEANLNEAAITAVGVAFTTLSKALGGAANCFWDIIRWADNGDDVVMQGGTTSGAAGNMDEAAVVDRSTGNQQGYGVVRELAAGAYGIQGNLTVGNSASSSDQYWSESNATYAWEDRGLSDRNYYRFKIIGSSTATNCEASFEAVTFSVPSAANAEYDANGADLTVCNMLGCSFIGFDVGIIASDDTGDDWTNCSFIDNGNVWVKGCDHTGSSFSGTLACALTESQDETSYDNTVTEGSFDGGTGYAATDTITLSNGALITVDTVSTGVVTEFTVTTSEGFPAGPAKTLTQSTTSGTGTGFELWPRSANLSEGGSIYYDLAVDPDGELDNCSFTKGTAATHAIVFGTNVPATMTLRGIAFSGYNAADSQTDSTLHFLDTTGTITVNLIDCTGNISYKSEGATIDLVVAPVVTKLTVETAAGVAIESARVLMETADNGGGSGLPYQASVSITQTGGTATVSHTAHGMATNDYVVIRGATQQGYNKQAQITVTGANAYTYSVDSGTASPATGSPVSSYAALSGTTNASGVIQSTKSWPAAQGIKGWARKSTSAPYYRETRVSIGDASGGTDLTIALQADE